VGASIVTGVDTAPVFELTENDLDHVPVSIERRVVRHMQNAAPIYLDNLLAK